MLGWSAGKKESEPCPPPEPAAVPGFLEPYGYCARSAVEWLDPHPVISLSVSGHSEVDAHTLYQLECQLSGRARNAPSMGWGGTMPPWSVEWRASLRLVHLRGGLHDVVKEQLGDNYPNHFSDTPFARRGGPAGTTARLDAWCQQLAKCINSKAVSPFVAATVLSLLRAPNPSITGVENNPSAPGMITLPKARPTPMMIVGTPMTSPVVSPVIQQSSVDSAKESEKGQPQLFRMDGEDSGGEGEDSNDEEFGDSFAQFTAEADRFSQGTFPHFSGAVGEEIASPSSSSTDRINSASFVDKAPSLQGVDSDVVAGQG